jgi:hypothetical protein
MIRPPDHVIRECREILSKMVRDEMDPQAACDRLLDLDPNYAPAYLQLGKLRADRGDLAAAESWMWKGLDLWPARPTFYFTLADLRLRTDLKDPLGQGLKRLAIRKMAAAPGIDSKMIELFGESAAEVGLDLDFSDPYTFKSFSAALEYEASKITEPSDVSERLLPYRLLTALQEDAPETVPDQLLDDILANAARMTTVLHAAIREWAIHPEALGDEALCMAVALIGEIGEPELIGDLLELGGKTDWTFFLHLHWALWRMGERFPSEALEAFRKSARDASAAWRCGMAEHIGMLPDIPGLAPALLEILDDFPPRGNPDDIGYLLAVVVDALSQLGMEEDADQVMVRYEPLLARPARKWLQDVVTSEEGFIPKLAAEAIDEWDITDVCIERVLMGGKEQEEAGGEGPQAPAVKPGRNDPCWCGSGKKYKKCHLAADEEAARPAGGPKLVPMKRPVPLEDAGPEDE